MSSAAYFQLSDIRERLIGAVEELIESGSYQDWLSFVATVPAYSARNTLLIYDQALRRGFRPTVVMGYHAWKERSRYVKRGEVGLRIYAPILRGRSRMDAMVSDVVGYRCVSVFDLSQTDGEVIPEPLVPVVLAGDVDESLFAIVLACFAELGFRCQIESLSGANGRTDFSQRLVSLDASLPAKQRLKTSLHELGHVLLHQEYSGEVARAELEAESFAYIVLASLGLDVGEFSFPYLVRWCGGKVDEAFVEASMRALEVASDFVKSRLGEQLLASVVTGSAVDVDVAAGGDVRGICQTV